MTDKKVHPSDQIIAFMGPTGAGKSHFIDTLTQNKDKWAGSGLKSVTQRVRSIRLQNPRTNSDTLVLVDTPGFDDTTRSDMEILQMIGDWLKNTYKEGVKLAGIVYVHRITDNRMSGTPHRNLRMFGELCGDKAVQRVVLVTTMWDKLKTRDIGEQRERELRESYWKVMIEKGASTCQFDNTNQGAWEVINPILESHAIAEAVLLQEELVDFHRRLNETRAGKTLYTELQKLLAKQKETLAQLTDQARGANSPLAADFEEEQKRIAAELDKTFKQVDALKISLGRRVLLFFTRKSPTNPLPTLEP